jgi:hypothetical protein
MLKRAHSAMCLAILFVLAILALPSSAQTHCAAPAFPCADGVNID